MALQGGVSRGWKKYQTLYGVEVCDSSFSDTMQVSQTLAVNRPLLARFLWPIHTSRTGEAENI